MRDSELTVEYNESINQYSQGYRFVLVKQHGKSFVLVDHTGAAWGQGIYVLNSNNTIGDCVDWNYDSSD